MTTTTSDDLVATGIGPVFIAVSTTAQSTSAQNIIFVSAGHPSDYVCCHRVCIEQWPDDGRSYDRGHHLLEWTSSPDHNDIRAHGDDYHRRVWNHHYTLPTGVNLRIRRCKHRQRRDTPEHQYYR
jgi:hypothetical protein